MTAESRDIAELDGLANEVAVCINKSDNYADTARQKIASVATALDAGEFGDWTLNQWLLIKVGLEAERVQVYLPRPGELAKAMVQAHPEMSDRAIAKKLGIGNKTASRARATVSNDTVQLRVGLDGKERRAPVRADTTRSAVVQLEARPAQPPEPARPSPTAERPLDDGSPEYERAPGFGRMMVGAVAVGESALSLEERIGAAASVLIPLRVTPDDLAHLQESIKSSIKRMQEEAAVSSRAA
ncbi:MAG TPA: hypothetical protein VFQ90_00200 [Stellaceae bacterium]|jgi:hypothetical protein|nr:hypothetical protein [Stellaceae bacterium]